MKSSKLSIKFRITFWYTLVFSLILALVFFYIYFLSKSYSIHDLQEELKDESADMLENLYDKSNRNDILYNADWTKFCAGAKSKNYDSYGHWSRILYNMLWIFAVLFPITVFISAFVGYHILKKALQPIYTISDMAKEISFPSIFQNVLKHQTLMTNFLTWLMHLIL